MKSNSTYSLPFNQVYWPLRRSRIQSSPQRSLSLKLNDLLHVLVSRLSVSSDPYVWETRNASGETVWSAEDQASGKTIRNVPETDLRVWLEERYQF